MHGGEDELVVGLFARDDVLRGAALDQRELAEKGLCAAETLGVVGEVLQVFLAGVSVGEGPLRVLTVVLFDDLLDRGARGALFGLMQGLPETRKPGEGLLGSAAGLLRVVEQNVGGGERRVGFWVVAGQAIMVMESMKTEIEVPAPVTGRVARLLAAPGTPVQAGQAVAVLSVAG